MSYIMITAVIGALCLVVGFVFGRRQTDQQSGSTTPDFLVTLRLLQGAEDRAATETGKEDARKFHQELFEFCLENPNLPEAQRHLTKLISESTEEAQIATIQRALDRGSEASRM